MVHYHDSRDSVKEVAAFYTRTGIAPIVRYHVPPHSPELEQYAAAAGWNADSVNESWRVWQGETGPEEMTDIPGVTISVATPAEFEDILAIQNEGADEQTAFRRRGVWSALIAHPDTDCILASVAGEPAAGLACVWNAGWGSVENVETRERFRRRGICAAMIRFSQRLAVERKARGLYLYDTEAGPDRIYARAGFELVARVRHVQLTRSCLHPEENAGGTPALPGSAGDTPAPPEATEWRSRGYLPHRDAPELVQMVTFRLADSLPAAMMEELRRMPAARRGAERRKRAEDYLDAGYGACYLRTPAIARIVEDALLRFDGVRYRLLAWSIMPNHVHVLVELLPEYALAKVLHTWKSYTAHAANGLLKRSGPFWQIEYWDRYIRDQQHFENAVSYINGNRSPFSSAARETGAECKLP